MPILAPLHRLNIFVRERFRQPTWIWIVMGLLVYFFTKELRGIGDFYVMYDAAEDISAKGPIYNTFYGVGFRYFYSPLFASVLNLFTVFEKETLGWMLKAANILLTYRVWVLLVSYLPTEEWNHKKRKRFTLLAFFFTIYLWYSNIHSHQMTILLIWAIFESLRLTKKDKPIIAGLLLALVINIKIIPIVIIPYLLWRTYYKTAASAILFTVLYLILPAVWIGWDYNLSLLSAWWERINPANAEHVLDLSEQGLGSITTFFSVFFTDAGSSDQNFEFNRHFMDLPIETITYLINGFRVIAIIGFLYFLRSGPFKVEKNKLKQLWELSYLLLITVLIFPHQQHYGFLLVCPAILYCTWYWTNRSSEWSKANKWLIFSCLFTITLAINASFLLGDFHSLWKYIKIITWGTLAVLPFLILWKPQIGRTKLT